MLSGESLVYIDRSLTTAHKSQKEGWAHTWQYFLPQD